MSIRIITLFDVLPNETGSYQPLGGGMIIEIIYRQGEDLTSKRWHDYKLAINIFHLILYF